jgi:hypothetical protein
MKEQLEIIILELSNFIVLIAGIILFYHLV